MMYCVVFQMDDEPHYFSQNPPWSLHSLGDLWISPGSSIPLPSRKPPVRLPLHFISPWAKTWWSRPTLWQRNFGSRIPRVLYYRLQFSQTGSDGVLDQTTRKFTRVENEFETIEVYGTGVCYYLQCCFRRGGIGEFLLRVGKGAQGRWWWFCGVVDHVRGPFVVVSNWASMAWVPTLVGSPNSHLPLCRVNYIGGADVREIVDQY